MQCEIITYHSEKYKQMIKIYRRNRGESRMGKVAAGDRAAIPLIYFLVMNEKA